MHRIEQIISILSNAKSSTVKSKSKPERVALKLQYIFLVLSMVTFTVCVILAVIHSHTPLSPLAKLIGLSAALLTQVLAILSFLPDLIVGIVTIIMWKRHMLTSLIEEIDKDEQNAHLLMIFKTDELQYAKFWIETKISRIEARLKLFFGDKTAAIALLGLTWPVVKELGGLGWLSSTYNNFMTTGHVIDTIIWLCLALLLGFSLGGIMLKNINERYKYQVSLIELCFKLKSMDNKPSCEK